jgi:hypothetical protein
MTQAGPSRRPSLLVVFAHPDDEIFHGTLMHLRQQGVRVTLVCVAAFFGTDHVSSTIELADTVWPRAQARLPPQTA